MVPLRLGKTVRWAPRDPVRGRQLGAVWCGGPPPAELRSPCVGASQRGTGLADRSWRAAMAEVPAFLWVPAENPRSHAFYARHGFVLDGHRAVDPDTGVLEQRTVRG